MLRSMWLDVCSKVLLVASLICIEDILGLEWKRKYLQAHYTLNSLPDSMVLNEEIFSEVTKADKVATCAWFCANNERSSLYYNTNLRTCYCNNDIDNRLTPGDQAGDGASEIIYGYLISSMRVSKSSTTLKYDVHPLKESCLALYHDGYTTNAIYTVEPIEENRQDTYCEMDNILEAAADDCLQWLQTGQIDDGVYNIRLSNGRLVRTWCDQTGGGWTVFQRRQDGSVDFLRTWTEYVNGFGDAAGEYWLGLEAIHLLSQQASSLRIDLEAFAGAIPPTLYALYDGFSLAPATDKYRLTIGAFDGDCGNGFKDLDQQQFSTWDSDNDQIIKHCADMKKGSWWFNECAYSNLNGMYRGGQYTDYTGIHWTTCWSKYYSAKTSSMGIKRD